jgi:hypothetical protein
MPGVRSGIRIARLKDRETGNGNSLNLMRWVVLEMVRQSHDL